MPSDPGAADPRTYRPLRSTGQLKRLMRGYAALTKIGPRLGLKTAWVTSGAPVEVPLSMGVIPQYPENFGALCGARKRRRGAVPGGRRPGATRRISAPTPATTWARIFAPDLAPLGGLCAAPTC